MAARHDAIIVPVASVGVEDCFEMLRDSQELLDTPFLGDALRSRVEGRIPVARR